ncbi:Thymidylate synthase ThyX [Clavibacter michiganensis subsp. michiganensis]|nr:Thymidylate synthase ThyX [Clavibacter michiganensis subsp. michiganensis]
MTVVPHDDIAFRSDMTVELVRSSAHDSDVIFAARVSTAGEKTLERALDEPDGQDRALEGDVDTEAEEKRVKRDRGLINYLMRDRHGSPFEHNSMTFYVQAPIFVFREFMRHRMASYNEESGRYKELDAVFYVPGPSATSCRSASPVPTSSTRAPPSRRRSCRRRPAAPPPRHTPPTSGCSRRAWRARSPASCSR